MVLAVMAQYQKHQSVKFSWPFGLPLMSLLLIQFCVHHKDKGQAAVVHV